MFARDSQSGFFLQSWNHRYLGKCCTAVISCTTVCNWWRHCIDSGPCLNAPTLFLWVGCGWAWHLLDPGGGGGPPPTQPSAGPTHPPRGKPGRLTAFPTFSVLPKMFTFLIFSEVLFACQQWLGWILFAGNSSDDTLKGLRIFFSLHMFKVKALIQ